ncbi:MAG: flippase-like domain-containing protein [Bacteroidales bacterium]|nr:flippase-like domain-containing protein [Bacteroidales bacterium]
MKTKVRKTYNFLIRLLIIIATYGFIYHQVFYKRDIEAVYQAFLGSFSNARFINMILLVIFLMALNWGTEAFKWKLLINKIEKLSWTKSLKAVLTGVAVSSFTPNRVGDYFGRVFILERANRIEGVFITILGSMSQLLITFLAGTSCIYMMFMGHHYTLLPYFNIPAHLYEYFLWGGGILILGLDILFIMLFLNISLLSSLASKLKGKILEKFTSYIHVLSAYTQRELLHIILLSMFRFFVFSVQLYLLLRVFSVNLPFIQGMVIVGVIFFTITIIPTIAITELGIRGSVSLFIIGVYYGSPFEMPASMVTGIVAASTSLWLINLVIPALIGAIFVFNLKFFRRSADE